MMEVAMLAMRLDMVTPHDGDAGCSRRLGRVGVAHEGQGIRPYSAPEWVVVMVMMVMMMTMMMTMMMVVACAVT
jgi:hypothetical protein